MACQRLLKAGLAGDLTLIAVANFPVDQQWLGVLLAHYTECALNTMPRLMLSFLRIHFKKNLCFMRYRVYKNTHIMQNRH